MLSPSEYEHLCDQLITLYDDLDNAIINDMVKRMMKTGKVTEATAWQAKQLQQSGMLYEDILEEIAKRTNATRNQVRTLFEDAGVQSIRNDNRSYKAAGLETIVKMSDAALQTLNAGYKKCMGDLSNLTLTTANTSQTAYIKACNLAYMEVTSGTMDYGTAIRRAVQSAADEGSWILYPSGHRDRLDVAVRRSVLTGVGQTVRKISEINANDMDCDIMEITAHAGARPSHAEWQGQFASLSGKNAGKKIDGARVYSLKEIGYGTGDGFGGWNCRHDWFPFFEGISSRAYSNQRLKDLNAKNVEYNGKMYSEYEIDQMQRALERKVRERKRAVSAADTAVKNAPDDQTANQMKAFFTEQSVKLKQAEKNLSDFINATGNLPDGTRTWVNGFGRSTAQKVVWANRKAQPQLHMASIPKNNSKGSGNSGNSPKNSQKTLDNSQNNGIIKSSGSGFQNTKHTYERIGKLDFSNKKAVVKALKDFENKYRDSQIEHCRVICTNGEIYEVHGDLDTVDTSILGDRLKGSINEHNHVTGESQYSFSWEDLASCVEDGTKMALAFDEKYRYSMTFPDVKIDKEFLQESYENSISEVNKINFDSFYSGNGKAISDEDYQHEVIKRTCEKVGIKYDRHSKT